MGVAGWEMRVESQGLAFRIGAEVLRVGRGFGHGMREGRVVMMFGRIRK